MTASVRRLPRNPLAGLGVFEQERIAKEAGVCHRLVGGGVTITCQSCPSTFANDEAGAFHAMRTKHAVVSTTTTVFVWAPGETVDEMLDRRPSRPWGAS